MNDTNYFFEKTSMSWKKNIRKRAARNFHGKSFCIIRIPWRSEFSTIEFLKGVAERVKKLMCCSSVRKSSNRVSSSMERSKTIGISVVDYYRAAAVEDCIEFIHIHSSFSRSNSLTMAPREEFTHSSLRKFDHRT
uniref:Josephin-like protein n=1 Tax=Cicer arietinum TaxID=3827 RepID=A0A3Q7XS13_CICAR|nr:josephin-like protein [Cicer arietinum]